MRTPNAILVGLLALIAGIVWPQAAPTRLEAGKLYRLAKDTPIIARHPRDYAKKAHEADFGTITGARTLKAGTGIRIIRVRDENSAIWYFVEVPDPNAFTPPLRNASGWINEVDLSGAPPAPIDTAAASGTKVATLAPETRFLLIHHAAAMRVCEQRAEAEPARRTQWLAWREESRRERERLVRDSGIDPAALESMLRATSVEDYAYWAAARQIPADPAIKPGSAFSKPISGSTMIDRYPRQEPPAPPPAAGGRPETSMQPRRR